MWEWFIGFSLVLVWGVFIVLKVLRIEERLSFLECVSIEHKVDKLDMSASLRVLEAKSHQHQREDGTIRP